MLDIPCGDWEWMRLVEREMGSVRYYGADIAPDLIECLKSQYGRADRCLHRRRPPSLVAAPAKFEP